MALTKEQIELEAIELAVERECWLPNQRYIVWRSDMVDRERRLERGQARPGDEDWRRDAP